MRTVALLANVRPRAAHDPRSVTAF